MPTLAYSNTQTSATGGTLTSTSFTPQTNDIIVVKAISGDSVNGTFGTPSGGGWTYTQQVSDTTASHVGVKLWTALVTAGGTSQTVSVVESGTEGHCQMTVELWHNAKLAATPATADARGTGAPSTPLTTAAANSAVSWANGDWAAVDGASRTYNTTSATPTEDGYNFASGFYTGYSAYQTAGAAGSQTLGLTAPTGQTWTLFGIEIQDNPPAGGVGQAQPGRTWLRRFHHRQVLPPAAVVAAAPATGPPVYPLGHPVQARGGPQPGGRVARRSGAYAGTGPPVRPPHGPVKAQPAVPVLTGRADSRSGLYGGVGPAVKALVAPVATWLRGLPPRGRTAGKAGIYAGTGPPAIPLHGPVQARRLPSRGGSTSSRRGTYGGLGPPVKPADGPVRAQPGPQRGGRTSSRAGTFTVVVTGSGPPVYPLGHPVQARRLPQRGGIADGRQGTFAGTGPPVRAADSPVRAVQPLPPHGRIQSRAGTFTAATPQAGPPVYPLGHPVQARRLPAQGGRVIRAAGTYAGTGAPPIPLRQPVGIGRRQPPLPVRGRTASLRGPYASTGPPAMTLRHPVRAQPQVPFLTGRADSRTGTFTAPPALVRATATVRVTDPRDGTTKVTGLAGSTAVTGNKAVGTVTDPRDGTTSVTDPRDGTTTVR